MANELVAVGPPDPVHGFPLWYEDSDGTRLELGLDPTDPNLPALELPTPGAPVTFPDNFPDEAFYFLAEAEMLVGGPAGPARARLILGLEAAFGGTGAVTDGQQMVFGRVRIRIDDVEPGATYTATHPYGVLDGVADDRGRVFETEDIGATGDFTSAFASSIGPFLRWQAAPPAGYLGDGTSERTVRVGTTGPQGFFLLEGPGVGTGPAGGDPTDPGNPNKARTALFTVQAKEATRFGVAVPRAVYTPTAGGADVDVFATSVPGRTLFASGPGVEAATLRGDDTRYVARTTAGAPPATVTVTSTSDVPPFAVTVPVTDLVTITDATYDLDAGQLTVAATSSDTRPLTVAELGVPVGTLPTAAPPAFVTVTSDRGGVATAAVVLTGAAFAAVDVVAAAGPDRTVEAGQEVRLDGAGSVGATGFTWQQTAGPAVTLTGGTTATPTFTAPAAGSVLTFALSVTGRGGPQADSVTVTVAAAQPGGDQITPGRVEFRTGRGQWRVEGTVSAALPDLVTARLGDATGPEIGTAAADVDKAFDVRRDLVPADAALRPVAGDVVTLTSTRGGTRVVAVTLRN